MEPGQGGCGVPDTDGDQDGVANCIDQCPVDPNKTEIGNCVIVFSKSLVSHVLIALSACPTRASLKKSLYECSTRASPK